MSDKDFKYVIISPVRNEEKKIQETIKSVVSQTIKPIKWVIVNDGSSDNTYEIAQKFGSIIIKHPKNLGNGAAIQTGLNYCKQNEPFSNCTCFVLWCPLNIDCTHGLNGGN